MGAVPNGVKPSAEPIQCTAASPIRCGHEPEHKIIDIFVCKLRQKLAQATGGSHYIETVWGRGYVLRDPAQ
jgi:hypothetical protein